MVQDGHEIVRMWSEMVWDGLKLHKPIWNGPRWSEIVQDGLKWYKMVQGGPRFQNSQRYMKHWGKYILHTYGLSAGGAKACSKKRKRSTILPFCMVQSFFCVLFFFLYPNLSVWPGRQVVPDGSRCYIPIFDGLVYHRAIMSLVCFSKFYCLKRMMKDK